MTRILAFSMLSGGDAALGPLLATLNQIRSVVDAIMVVVPDAATELKLKQHAPLTQADTVHVSIGIPDWMSAKCSEDFTHLWFLPREAVVRLEDKEAFRSKLEEIFAANPDASGFAFPHRSEDSKVASESLSWLVFCRNLSEPDVRLPLELGYTSFPSPPLPPS